MIYRDDEGELEGEDFLVDVVVRVVVVVPKIAIILPPGVVVLEGELGLSPAEVDAVVPKIVRILPPGIVLEGELGLSSAEVDGPEDSSEVAPVSDVDMLDVEVWTISCADVVLVSSVVVDTAPPPGGPSTVVHEEAVSCVTAALIVPALDVVFIRNVQESTPKDFSIEVRSADSPGPKSGMNCALVG